MPGWRQVKLARQVRLVGIGRRLRTYSDVKSLNTNPLLLSKNKFFYIFSIIMPGWRNGRRKGLKSTRIIRFVEVRLLSSAPLRIKLRGASTKKYQKWPY